MSFLNPGFLFALFALAIPVIIHLFNFRRYKKISFTNVQALKDIESTSQSVRRIRNLLTLAARILGLTFLVLAFAQPFIPAQRSSISSGEDRMAIFLDNSMSSSAYFAGRSSFENTKELASSLVKDLSNGSPVHLLNNDFKQSEFNGLNVDDAVKEIEVSSTSARSRDFKQILDRLNEVAKEVEGTLHAYILSDFQRSQFGILPQDLDSNIQLHLVYLPWESDNNISIDSAWMMNPSPSLGGNDSLGLVIKNYGAENIQALNLRMYVNDKQVWMNSVDVPSNGRTTLMAPLQQNDFGNYAGRMEIGDDLMEFDNELYFSYAIDSAPQVYYIGPEQYRRNLSALFKPPFIYKENSLGEVDVSMINESNLIVLAINDKVSEGLTEAIQNRLNTGASLLLIPGDSLDLTYSNELLASLQAGQLKARDTSKTVIQSINRNSELLRSALERLPDNPNLPWVKLRLHHQLNADKPFEDILEFKDGPALRRIPSGEGNILLLCFNMNPSNTNLMDHSLFVPLLLNAAFMGNKKGNLYLDLNQPGLLTLESRFSGDQVFHLKGLNTDIIPEIKRLPGGLALSFDEQINEAGNFNIELENEMVQGVSFNFSRSESDPSRVDASTFTELSEQMAWSNLNVYSGELDKLNKLLTGAAKPKPLWKYCVILALVFFIAELLILKFVHI